MNLCSIARNCEGGPAHGSLLLKSAPFQPHREIMPIVCEEEQANWVQRRNWKTTGQQGAHITSHKT